MVVFFQSSDIDTSPIEGSLGPAACGDVSPVCGDGGRVNSISPFSFPVHPMYLGGHDGALFSLSVKRFLLWAVQSVGPLACFLALAASGGRYSSCLSSRS